MGGIDEISREIGGIKVSIENLEKDNGEAKKIRQKTLDSLGKIENYFQNVQAEMEDIKKRLDQVEKPIEKIEKLSQRGIGAISAIILILAFASAGATSILDKIWSLLKANL